ncbi:MAG: hypothetical protein AAGJ82_09895 [Bacteroidota bacterium]
MDKEDNRVDIYRLDRSAFAIRPIDDTVTNTQYWLTKTVEERIAAAYYLSLRAYGYDPAQPPRLDLTVFSTRTRRE